MGVDGFGVKVRGCGVNWYWWRVSRLKGEGLGIENGSE